MLACLLAIGLAALLTIAVPSLLRWCPLPQEAGDLRPFEELASASFRSTVFGVSALAGVVAFVLTAPRYWAVWAPFVTVGALLAVVDLRTRFLPFRLNYLALGLALAGAAVVSGFEGSWHSLLVAGAAGAVATAVFWVIWRFSGDRLGFGDVRLAGLIGVVTGAHSPYLPVWAFLLGSVAGGVWGIVEWIRKGKDGEFAYGPAMLLGPVLALVVSRALQLG